MRFKSVAPWFSVSSHHYPEQPHGTGWDSLCHSILIHLWFKIFNSDALPNFFTLHYITLDCTLRTYVNHHESVSKGLRNVIVQWEELKKTGCQLLWSISILCVTLLSGPSIDLPCQTWTMLNRFRKAKARDALVCTNAALSQQTSATAECGYRQTMNHAIYMCPSTEFNFGLVRLMMTQPTGWIILWQEHSQNEMKVSCG